MEQISEGSPEGETIDVNGISIDKVGGLIISATHGNTVRLGQTVRSNGECCVPAGTEGLVVALKMPYHNDRSSDIIEVWWYTIKRTDTVKFKHLQF